jgi:hypothetical protein
MILNSLNIKVLQKGNSQEALSFQSQSVNILTPQRERDMLKLELENGYIEYKSFIKSNQ